MYRILIAAAILAASILPAGASGGVGCDAGDETVTLTLGIGMTRGSGGFFSIDGNLDIADPAVPADLRSLSLDDKLIHSWVDGDVLKLQFYTERYEGEFAYLNLTIEADAKDEGSYPGTYSLTVFAPQPGDDPEAAPWTASGPVDCMVE